MGRDIEGTKWKNVIPSHLDRSKYELFPYPLLSLGNKKQNIFSNDYT
jgi:hypothetical protein